MLLDQRSALEAAAVRCGELDASLADERARREAAEAQSSAVPHQIAPTSRTNSSRRLADWRARAAHVTKLAQKRVARAAEKARRAEEAEESSASDFVLPPPPDILVDPELVVSRSKEPVPPPPTFP